MPKLGRRGLIAILAVGLLAIPVFWMESRGGNEPLGGLGGHLTDNQFQEYLEGNATDPVNVTFWTSDAGDANDTFHLFRYERQAWNLTYGWRDLGEFDMGDTLNVRPGLYKVIGDEDLSGWAATSPGFYSTLGAGHRVFLHTNGQFVDLGAIL